MPSSQPPTALFEKIRALPPDKLAQLEDFVDFLRLKVQEQRDAADLAAAAAVSKLSEPAFAKLWDNADDAEYDQL
jgi:hypothetical protein